MIKRLQGIHEKASRNYLDNMIKEITLKEKGNKQRLLKKEIIEELSEQVEGIEKILEDIKKDREK